MHRRTLLTLIAGAALLSASCSSDEAAAERSPAEQLATARAVLDRTSSLTLELTSTGVPPRQNGVTAAKGQAVVSATEPKFSGTVTGTVRGVPGQVQVVAIGETTWVKFFTPDFEKTDLATLGAPNPATFVDPEMGISTLLGATAGATSGGEIRAGREILRTVKGTLSGKRVTDLFRLGDGTGTYTVTYGIAAGDELRTATLVGPFFAGKEATYALTLTKYGEPVAIARP
jgi:lipoprotein LprG